MLCYIDFVSRQCIFIVILTGCFSCRLNTLHNYEDAAKCWTVEGVSQKCRRNNYYYSNVFMLCYVFRNTYVYLSKVQICTISSASDKFACLVQMAECTDMYAQANSTMKFCIHTV